MSATNKRPWWQFRLWVLLLLLGIIPIIIAAGAGAFGIAAQRLVYRYALQIVVVVTICVMSGGFWAGINWVRGVSDDD